MSNSTKAKIQTLPVLAGAYKFGRFSAAEERRRAKLLTHAAEVDEHDFPVRVLGGACVDVDHLADSGSQTLAELDERPTCAKCAGRDPRRLFVGVRSMGVSYADRYVDQDGDYRRIAFLPYSTLELEIYDRRFSLLPAVKAHAATLIARRGHLFALSSAGEADAKAGLATGQTVRLGSA